MAVRATRASAGEIPTLEIDTDSVRPLRLLLAILRAQAATTRVEVEVLAESLDADPANEIAWDGEDEISALYSELGMLSSQAPSAALDDQFQHLLKRLRMLQQAEAEAMAAEFDRRALVKKGSTTALLDGARQLLSETDDEDPAASNQPAKRADSSSPSSRS